jgi:hypothetical protein
MIRKRVTHWQYLKDRISNMRAGYPEGCWAYSDSLLLERDIQNVIIPLEHCSDLITAIEERLAYFANENSRCAAIHHLEAMKRELESQITEQSEQIATA